MSVKPFLLFSLSHTHEMSTDHAKTRIPFVAQWSELLADRRRTDYRRVGTIKHCHFLFSLIDAFAARFALWSRASRCVIAINGKGAGKVDFSFSLSSFGETDPRTKLFSILARRPTTICYFPNRIKMSLSQGSRKRGSSDGLQREEIACGVSLSLLLSVSYPLCAC